MERNRALEKGEDGVGDWRKRIGEASREENTRLFSFSLVCAVSRKPPQGKKKVFFPGKGGTGIEEGFGRGFGSKEKNSWGGVGWWVWVGGGGRVKLTGQGVFLKKKKKTPSCGEGL